MICACNDAATLNFDDEIEEDLGLGGLVSIEYMQKGVNIARCATGSNEKLVLHSREGGIQFFMQRVCDLPRAYLWKLLGVSKPGKIST